MSDVKVYEYTLSFTQLGKDDIIKTYWVTIRHNSKYYTCYPDSMTDNLVFNVGKFITCEKTAYEVISKYRKLKLHAIIGLYQNQLKLGGKK